MGFMDRMFQDHRRKRSDPPQPDGQITEKLGCDLQENIRSIRETLGSSDDVIIRKIRIDEAVHAAVLYIEGLSDSKSINDFILESLMQDIHRADPDESDLLLYLEKRILAAGDVRTVFLFHDLLEALLSGDAILLLDGYTQGVVIAMKGWESRNVTEASTETIIRGPKESFVENLRVNTALIRRRIKDPRLWLESRQIGKVTKTTVALMYINGIADDKVVEEVRKRLNRIDIDAILESGYIEQMIQDKTYTPFPTIYNTERPDVVAADLLEGRVAILVDGTPFVLTVPVIFIQYFQAAEDYYHRLDFATLLRLLRVICFFIAFLGPSLYIALTTFHQEMIPADLLISLVAQRESVPFPAFIEAVIMEVSFEILREAGIRMPRAIGQAVSIVGTLVVGTAAVDAGMVSAAMVIVVSITAISNFVFPSVSMAIPIRILRFPLMALAASFGLFGIVMGIIALLLHMCSLRSFGVPYMSPFAPLVPSDLKDSIFRFPQWAMFTRPRLISQNNIVRERTPAPVPPKSNE